MKTIKELKDIEKRTLKLANQGRYLNADDLKALDIIPAIITDRKDILKLIEEVFSEGWFNYFHTNYAGESQQANENMIEDIDKKVQELKLKIKGEKALSLKSEKMGEKNK